MHYMYLDILHNFTVSYPGGVLFTGFSTTVKYEGAQTVSMLWSTLSSVTLCVAAIYYGQ